ncbi:MAG: nickel pincer cofactor biosynthesis protein LarB [Planctomycetota bacterium]
MLPASADEQHDLRAILTALERGEHSVDETLARLVAIVPPTVRIDHDRERRCGFPEVVFGSGKSPEDLVAAARAVMDRHQRLLVTRVPPSSAAALQAAIPQGVHHPRAHCFTCAPTPLPRVGRVAILCAGTSDVGVAEEARITAEITGSATDPHYDVGVAGVHRLLRIESELRAARVLVVVAGMEGALPSVVAGLVSVPVIAVPTSVGYGAAFGGLAALLGMLNSCAAGVSVVNIDNGYGAGMLASRINQMPPLPSTSSGAP